MKILLIGFTKFKFMPYMHFYLDRINLDSHSVHILRWNRDSSPDINVDKRLSVHTFEEFVIDESSILKKVVPFLKFKRFAQRILDDGNFDRVIILHSLPGVLIHQYLCACYQKKFILDYRDQTYELFPPFSRVLAKLAMSAYATFVSSDAYRPLLPKNSKIYSSHNLLIDSMAHMNIGKRGRNTPINITFWGLIRHYEINEQVIMKFGNDSRFILNYYGREQDTAFRLKELSKKGGFANVFFHGEYFPEERYIFAQETMIVHNLYDSNDLNIKKAIGNKYYDSLVFGIPQICTVGSYMAEMVEENGTGLACDPFSEDFTDVVYDYYMSIDFAEFLMRCSKALESINTDLKIADRVVTSFLGYNANGTDPNTTDEKHC